MEWNSLFHSIPFPVLATTKIIPADFNRKLLNIEYFFTFKTKSCIVKLDNHKSHVVKQHHNHILGQKILYKMFETEHFQFICIKE